MIHFAKCRAMVLMAFLATVFAPVALGDVMIHGRGTELHDITVEEVSSALHRHLLQGYEDELTFYGVEIISEFYGLEVQVETEAAEQV
eukprot:CAMPEP_0182866974 /NCGR_PEP_ID=MMETSP0034_2-20130328/8476_1 /TAXON_ID=156128 /ORGANISM="Nephroselmis pyriformis, Strain CCMP717" /LENGTH=87 /DNA_ID=CAMNT_0024999307 /DNA_START=284 /DNA_END=543 /DNA_ORIENTATION=-